MSAGKGDRPLIGNTQRITEHYTEIVKYGRKYVVQLKVDHQSFPLSCEWDTKKQAKWVSDQLAIALERMISQQNSQDHPPNVG